MADDDQDERARHESIPRGDPSWLDAARDHAATAGGHAQLTAELEEAEALGDAQASGLLRAALLRGETRRAESDEAARLAATRRPRILGQDDVRWVRDQFGVPTEQVLRDQDEWTSALGHQALIRVPAAQALTEVRQMWLRASPPDAG